MTTSRQPVAGLIEPGRQGESHYRADIDGLRAVAVLGVVFCHAELGLPGGYVGVDVFFVISGYLIGRILFQETLAGKLSLQRFWERRIRRILPALAVVCLVTAVGAHLTLLPEEYTHFGQSLVSVAALCSNVLFWRTTGYFAPAAAERPLLHTWSLAVEEQFYLFIPFMFWLAGRSRLNWLPAMFVAGSVISLALAVPLSLRNSSAAFYLMPLRAWELLLGTMLVFPQWVRPPSSRGWASGASLLGLTGIAAPMVLYGERTAFPGLAAMPPVLGSAAIIWAGQFPSGLPWINRCLSARALVFVGLISYSLYLWHWPLLALARHQAVIPLNLSTRLGLVVVSLVLATLSWKFVETPFRRPRQAVRFSFAMGGALVTLALIAVGGYVVNRQHGFAQRLPAKALEVLTPVATDKRLQRNVTAGDVPDRMITFGATSTRPTVLLWGDSHGGAILPGLDALCRDAGIAGVAVTHLGNPPLSNFDARNPAIAPGASRALADAVLQHCHTHTYEAILLVARWTFHAETSGADLSAALDQTLSALQQPGTKVYVMQEVSTFPYSPPRLLARLSWQQREWPTPQSAAPPIAMSKSIYHSRFRVSDDVAVVAKRRGAIVLTPLDALLATSSDTWLPFDDLGTLYADDNHLNTRGALALKAMFEPILAATPQEAPASRRPASRATLSVTEQPAELAP